MKPIMLTQEAKDNALEIFKKLLETTTDSDGLKINITSETLLQAQGIEKPTVFVLAKAYLKMITLINNSDKELAWYGIARRVNKNYCIEDILVYPQSVTAATVDADEEKCAKWFMELPDETINNLKFQGHSHVNMSTNPSGRDTNNWHQFANLLKPGEFYILCIGNKRGEFYWNIYDKAINVCFENKDITMSVVDDNGNSITDWAKDSIKKYIIEEKPIQNYKQMSYFANSDQAPVTVTKPKTTVATNSTYKEMLTYIPDEFNDVIDYEVESDVYFAYQPGLPDFYYSSLYDCFICQGTQFRRLNPKRNKTIINNTFNNKKKESKTSKKGVKT